MNKTAIKNFAIWARNKLVADISYRAGLMGITTDGIRNALPQSTGTTEFYDIGTSEPFSIGGDAVKQRKHLVELIRRKEKETNYKTAYKYVLEEVAYTWFNRLIAVRFMEVNDYLPSHVRVLSSDSGKMEPDLVTTPFEADLSFTEIEEREIYRLKQENKLDELFRLLFIKQCNALNEILPELFEKTSDYTELLINFSYIDQDGVVNHLVHDIPESDFNIKEGGQVEIIGWLYQYYISDPKDALINAHKKYQETEIPYVTQLFTPDWIVRYMVENTIGRLWIEHLRALDESLDDAALAITFGWKYYLPEAKQEPEAETKLREMRKDRASLTPEQITMIDPCMGSGHILVYAFDVLMQIYEFAGYSQRDAARSILANNLFGLDIDDRAYQMAYFAVMMKARQYNRRVLFDRAEFHLFSIHESNDINSLSLDEMGGLLSCDEYKLARGCINHLLDSFSYANVFGSLLIVEKYDWTLLRRFAVPNKKEGQLSLDINGTEANAKALQQIINVAEALTRTYSVAITNPPYMNSSLMPDKLKAFLTDEYREFKNDLFSAFIFRLMALCSNNAHIGVIMPYVWMYISSYEEMRKWFNRNAKITSLVQLEYNAFEAACVPVATLSFRKSTISCSGEYIKLSDFRGAENQAPRMLYAIENEDCGYRYTASQEDFKLIPGEPMAFWFSKAFFEAFTNPKLGTVAHPVEGIKTGDNERFLRLWFEVNRQSTYLSDNDSKDSTWHKMVKGGEFRRWYGNLDYVCKWNGSGEELKDFKGSAVSNISLFFTPAITWTYLTSSLFSMRYVGDDTLYNNKGPGCYVEEGDIWYLLALMNSKTVQEFLSVLAPTIDYKPGNLSNVPIVVAMNESVNQLSKECWRLSKKDWDSFESSWDFRKHPLI